MCIVTDVFPLVCNSGASGSNIAIKLPGGALGHTYPPYCDRSCVQAALLYFPYVYVKSNI